jgi:hypothetical protein
LMNMNDAPQIPASARSMTRLRCRGVTSMKTCSVPVL